MLLAEIKGAEPDPDTVVLNSRLSASFAGSAKSSFQRDLENNKPSEIDSLLKYVITASAENGLPATAYNEALKQITRKYNLNG